METEWRYSIEKETKTQQIICIHSDLDQHT